MTNWTNPDNQALCLAFWIAWLGMCLVFHSKPYVLILELRKAYLDWQLERTTRKYTKLLKRSGRYIEFGDV